MLTLVASAGFLIYTMKMRKKSVIRMAQPPFLAMICAGTMLMAAAIIPISMDEGVAASQSALDASCSMTHWFFSFGFTITFAALFSKLWRVNKVRGPGFSSLHCDLRNRCLSLTHIIVVLLNRSSMPLVHFDG